jgi:hypothetical protein
VTKNYAARPLNSRFLGAPRSTVASEPRGGGNADARHNRHERLGPLGFSGTNARGAASYVMAWRALCLVASRRVA